MSMTTRFRDNVFLSLKKFVMDEQNYFEGIREAKQSILKFLVEQEEDNYTPEDSKTILQDWCDHYDKVFDQDNSDSQNAGGWSHALDRVIRDSDLTWEGAKEALDDEIEVNRAYLEGIKLALTYALASLNEHDDKDEYFEEIGDLLNNVEDEYPTNGILTECRYSDGQSEVYELVLAAQ